jgi:hypothetical protein
LKGPKIEYIVYHLVENGERCRSTEIATFWTIQIPNNVLYGEGIAVIITNDGSQTITFVGREIGHVSSSDKTTFRSTLFYRTSSNGKFAFLSNLNGVPEYDVDEQGNTTAKV